ncbi:MAG: TIGR02757 family protein [Bacteroidales bacterium]|jgi:uncharacterized protein (TIGR02757 family)|nr:TIGR02757 family protein [Bacteroidales bacterium]
MALRQNITLEHLIKTASQQYNVKEFIEEDPIQFPHRYKKQTDIEISAFISAWLAYGNRKAFLKVLENIHILFELSPTEFIINRNYASFQNNKDNLYRFYVKEDFYQLCECLRAIYVRSDTMEQDVRKMLKVLDFNGVLNYFFLNFKNVKGIPKDAKSACKRLCMFLRWMVRKDGIVDFGIWSVISPQELIIPLDTHVFNTAKHLGIINSNSANLKTAHQITDYLRRIFPSDPCLGDFALYGLGIADE